MIFWLYLPIQLKTGNWYFFSIKTTNSATYCFTFVNRFVQKKTILSLLWKELVKLALIGTERSSIPPSVAKALEAYGIDTTQDITRVVLEGAALQSPLQKAGFMPETWNSQTLAPSPPEQLTNCSKESIEHLSLILQGIYSHALDEFIEGMILYKKCLPFELLPAFLDECVKDDALWQKLQAVIGKRGQWLIHLNPAWQKLEIIVSQKKWETGTKAERIAILKQLRADNPLEGFKMLLSTWAEDGLQEKAAFLKCLKIGLSLSDEAFLEENLDFPRKEIRTIATELLSQLKNSAWQQRMYDRLKMAIQIKKEGNGKERLEIQLPDTSEKALLRDGINPKKKWRMGNEKTGALKQMVTVLPPEKWEEHFEKTPEAIIQLFSKSEWAVMLVEASAEAAALHQSASWMEAILLFWLENEYKSGWSKLKIDPILNTLPNELFNKILLKKLKAAKILPNEDSPLIRLMEQEGYRWENQLTKTFMQQLKEWMLRNPSYSWSGWKYRNLLKRAAYTVSPAMEKHLHQLWLSEPHHWAGWERDIQQFFNTLNFRKEMLEALKPTENGMDL